VRRFTELDMNDQTKSDPAEPVPINEVFGRYWSEKFGITPADLREEVTRVGPDCQGPDGEGLRGTHN